MSDSSDGSLWETSNEVQTRADEALRLTLDELSRQPERRPRDAPRATQSAPPPSEAADLARRFALAAADIAEVKTSGQSELESLDPLRAKQKEAYQDQLSAKNEIWQQQVFRCRQEAADLRATASHLAARITAARAAANGDVDDAQRRAAESTGAVRVRRERQLRELSGLTRTLDSERKQFALELQQAAAANEAAVHQKGEQIVRLQAALAAAKSKLRDTEVQCEVKFKDQVRRVRELRTQLQQAKDFEAEKQSDLMALRLACAVTSRKISARRDETAALKRQLATLLRDNEELRAEVIKMETGLFPGAFRATEF
jgi:chromosome segregation ATPase